MSGRNLPIREAQFDVGGFNAWLTRQGYVVKDPIGDFEVTRYLVPADAGSKPHTLVIYRRKNTNLTYMPKAKEHYRSFLGLEKGGVPAVRPSKRARDRVFKQVFARDGGDCWYCGCELAPEQRTLEHLLALSKGGPNNAANGVIACDPCNSEAGDKSVAEKVAFRAIKRTFLGSTFISVWPDPENPLRQQHHISRDEADVKEVLFNLGRQDIQQIVTFWLSEVRKDLSVGELYV